MNFHKDLQTFGIKNPEEIFEDITLTTRINVTNNGNLRERETIKNNIRMVIRVFKDNKFEVEERNSDDFLFSSAGRSIVVDMNNCLCYSAELFNQIPVIIIINHELTTIMAFHSNNESYVNNLEATES